MLKYLVVYSSLTGNTKMVAESIAQEIGADLKAVEENPSSTDYDMVAVGFWADKGGSDSKATEYLKTLKNAKVALFMTLGADPQSDHSKKTLEKAASYLDSSNEVVGNFACQGKIDPKLIERMNKMFAEQKGQSNPHAPSKERDERHKKASTHPDEQDLVDAKFAFKQIVENLVK